MNRARILLFIILTTGCTSAGGPERSTRPTASPTPAFPSAVRDCQKIYDLNPFTEKLPSGRTRMTGGKDTIFAYRSDRNSGVMLAFPGQDAPKKFEEIWRCKRNF